MARLKPREELFKIPKQKAVIHLADGQTLTVYDFEVVTRRSVWANSWQALFKKPRLRKAKHAKKMG